MGQVLQGSAKTTYAVRAAIQRSQASISELSQRYGINPKTVCKWKQRNIVEYAPVGPKKPHSTVLSLEEEAVCVAFRRHTLLPLDDCLYALQASIPHLTRSSLHDGFTLEVQQHVRMLLSWEKIIAIWANQNVLRFIVCTARVNLFVRSGCI